MFEDHHRSYTPAETAIAIVRWLERNGSAIGAPRVQRVLGGGIEGDRIEPKAAEEFGEGELAAARRYLTNFNEWEQDDDVRRAVAKIEEVLTSPPRV